MRRAFLILLLLTQPVFAKFGERVVVRRADPADLPALEELFDQPEMREFYFMGEPRDPRAWLEYSRLQPFEPGQNVRSRYFIIADPVTNEFRGIITDITNKNIGDHELSYALDFMIDQAFREDPDGVVTATVLSTNKASRDLLLSKGFKHVGGWTLQMQYFELTLKCEAAVGGSR